ncbi:MAG TPA: hypothetical protein QGG18_10400 [Rhodospirillales bacterium]|nr:hypothetical protein [Rhodospirillales bacterium]
MAAVSEAHIHWLHTITIRQTGKLKQLSLILAVATWASAGGCPEISRGATAFVRTVGT